MSLPFFYIENLSGTIITLDEPTSKHMIGVLRMQKGESVLLTDGKGTRATAVIDDDNRKRCSVQIENIEKEPPASPRITIGISIIKNASRFEWFLEKATEIGVSQIIPLICQRTERSTFRYDRMQQILVSAMLQSQQSWLPVLHQPTAFTEVIKSASDKQKFIAHCLPEKKLQLSSLVCHPELAERNQSTDKLILIGPEGDFTEKEIRLAIENKFVPVALGDTRLRTETAGLVAATILKLA